MIEIAHFVQFFSFTIGVVAMYILALFRNKSNKAVVSPYFKFLLGINLIAFVHVIEAFLRIVMSPDLFQDFSASYMKLMVYLVMLLRIFIAFQFILFFLKLQDKKSKGLYAFIAIFFGLSYFLIRNLNIWFPEHKMILIELSNFFIHFLLFVTLSITTSILIKKKAVLCLKSNRLSDLLKLIFLYSISIFVLRAGSFLNFSNYADIQMFLLGMITLLFNLGNVFVIKPAFYTESCTIREKDFSNLNITKREAEVIQLICEGKTNKEIAEKLFITPVTVRDHCSNIYKKAGVKNRTQLASLFYCGNPKI